MRKLTVILLALMLVCAIIPQATASSDSLEVIVTVNKRIFQPGSEIDITVHVFDKGTYVSADDISVDVGYWPSEETVNVTETQTGVYKGTYTVKPEDTLVTITAMVTRGTDSDTGYTYIELEEDDEVVVDFSVDVTLDDPGDYQAQPGDAVEITVTVKLNGTLVDPDIIELDVEDQLLGYTHAGTGTFKATKNIPSGLNKGGSYDIQAYVRKDGMEDYDIETYNVLFFMVCYHELTKTNTTATFDLYVSDMNGKVVMGATLSISYDHDDNSGTSDITQQDATDSQGKAGFTITYEDISYIDIEGTVSHGSKSQNFDGTIWISLGGGIGTEEPRDEGFDIIDNSELKVYRSGDPVTRQYTAYMDGAPWASMEILYYVTEGFSPTYRVIKQGSVNSDSNGKLSVSFTAPEEMVIIIFKTGRPKTQNDFVYDEDDDLVYEEDMEYVITSSGADLPMLDWDDDVSISVDKLMVGGPTTVRVGGAVPSDGRVIAAWFVGSADDYLEMVTSAAFEYEWQCWTGMSGSALSMSDGEYSGEIVLPEYMPKNEDYTIIAGWITDDGETHLNHVVLEPGESGGTGTTTEDDDAGSDTFILIGVLVVILIVLLVVIKVATKPKKKGPM